MKKINAMMRGFAASLILLMTLASCTTQDILDPVTPENNVPVDVHQIVTIPYSIQVTADATKVSVDKNDKYTFQDNDVLVLQGKDRKDVQAVLTYSKEKGSFDGELSYDKALGMADVVLQGTIKGKGFTDGLDYSKAIAADMKEAVEQFSVFSTEFKYSSTNTNVYLFQSTAFIEFDILFEANKAMTEEKTVVELKDPKLFASGKADVKDGKAHFVAAFAGGHSLTSPCVKICGKEVTFTKKATILENNTRYTVERTIKPVVGDPYYSDGIWGKFGHKKDAEAIGIIVSIENAAVPAGKYALVMALHDAGSAKWGKWDKGNEKQVCDNADLVKNPDDAFEDFDGLGKTNKMASENFPAARMAVAYGKEVAAPANSTGWFLPAIGQWIAAVELLGETDPRSEWINEKGNKKWTLNNVVCVKKSGKGVLQLMNEYLQCYKGTLLYTGSNPKWNSYWTSSEHNAEKAIRMNFSVSQDDPLSYPSCIKIGTDHKTEKTYTVRPFLAF